MLKFLVKNMKKAEFIIAWFIAICLGAVMHMAHEWAELGHGVYYILPINECVWEHMKMIFYPMLLFALYLCLKKGSPERFSGPVLANILAIPVQTGLFFVYYPFTHHSVLIVDIIAYALVMAAAMWLGYRWSSRARLGKLWPLFVLIAIAEGVLMAYLTYNPMDNFLFNIK